jgi:ADP-heptose:LPS heptosyltransferase
MLYKVPFFDNDDIFKENQVKMYKFDVERIKENFESKIKIRVYGVKRTFLKKYEHFLKSVFRSIFKIIAVYLLNNRENKNYVAFVMHGGIGDKLRCKSAVTSLLNMFTSNTIVDIYDKKSRFIFSDVNIRFFLYNEVWTILKKKYDIMYIFGGSEVEIFSIKREKSFVENILKNISYYKNIYFSENNKNRHLISDIKARCGVDNIEDLALTINYKQKPLEKFNIDNSLKYITIQYGFGGDGKNDDLKCWDTKNWEKLIKILKNKFDNISIIQVGFSHYKLQNVDINVAKKTSYNELCSILKNSLLHIDIDGACSHIAWALRTKSIILFGPTDAKYSMYPENINIMSSICGGCWHRFGKCVIGEEKPSLCMNSIKPEFVAESCRIYK